MRYLILLVTLVVLMTPKFSYAHEWYQSESLKPDVTLQEWYTAYGSERLSTVALMIAGAEAASPKAFLNFPSNTSERFNMVMQLMVCLNKVAKIDEANGAEPRLLSQAISICYVAYTVDQ